MDSYSDCVHTHMLLQLRLENCKLWQRVCWHLCSARDNTSLVLCPCFLKQWHEVPSAKIFSSPHPPPWSGWILHFKSWYKRLCVFLILLLSCYMTTIFVTMTQLNVSKLWKGLIHCVALCCCCVASFASLKGFEMSYHIGNRNIILQCNFCAVCCNSLFPFL